MDFATLGVTTGGTATIDPVDRFDDRDRRLASPRRNAVAGTLRRGCLKADGGQYPHSQNAGSRCQRVGGTETLSVSNFTLDGQDKKVLAQQQSFTFAVGAQITVPAGTVEGLYTGEIDVTVQYP